ncbi:MAG TPA: HAMP domain-containing sensor histidine kinase [Verrucomicrobiae bacterium]|nr:HAMP domain-containing sensor histidine kinase [Verrucomicrobiae bacterium]
MAHAHSVRSWFGLQMVILAAPLLVLVLLGGYLIRQDKASVETEARQNVDGICRELLRELAQAQTNWDPAAYLDPTKDWPSNTAFVQVRANLERIFPPPVASNGLRADFDRGLTPAQSNLWNLAQAAEFRSNDFPAALKFWSDLIKTSFPTNMEAVVQFQRAVLIEKAGDTNGATAEFELLNAAPIEARLDSGLPVAHLAALKLLAKASAGEPEKAEQLARFCISNFLVRPTEFTPALLRHGKTECCASEFTQAEQFWDRQERARRLYDAVSQIYARAPAKETEMAAPAPIQFLFENARWWCFAQGTNLLFRSEQSLTQLAETAEAAQSLPEYVKVAIYLGGVPIIRPTNSAEEPVWTEARWNDLRCGVYLSDPSALYARQRQRARVFSALLALGTGCAVLGIIYAQRSFKRQARLNDLKSNFVSSVSHELRAPLASMRLMSEGLQSGRVRNPEKQNEYFKYLVQECRRLSALVENVLDFSRIEQNRRTFHFEDTDAREICRAALSTIDPVAREGKVLLQFESDPATENALFTVRGDGLALQQALVNLLDNAVKHSPPSATVQLRLTARESEIEISVRDNGPGIDPSEHERIFELFYRIGSELRRETPGVGIGLSIVKHTIEAHQGEVWVESSLGEGARFIIRIPRAVK